MFTFTFYSILLNCINLKCGLQHRIWPWWWIFCYCWSFTANQSVWLFFCKITFSLFQTPFHFCIKCLGKQEKERCCRQSYVLQFDHGSIWVFTIHGHIPLSSLWIYNRKSDQVFDGCIFTNILKFFIHKKSMES
jgi:hypothetical protein